jgi:hypothetical protein
MMKGGIDRLVLLAGIPLDRNEFIADQMRGAFNGAVSQMVMAMEAFLGKHSRSLPRDASNRWRAARMANVAGQSKAVTDPLASLVVLSAFVGELDALLSDPESEWAVAVERAFLHLERSLAVDEDLRRRWEVAFEGGKEPGLEKLGAVHLLSHGLYCFKAKAAGAESDLIVGERTKRAERSDLMTEGPLDDTEEQRRRAATPLVLTEWKRVKKAEDAKTQLGDAKSQLELYAKDAVASLELTTVCFAVLVSKEQLGCSFQGETLGNGMEMRVVNIPIAPFPPSKAAQKTRATAAR